MSSLVVKLRFIVVTSREIDEGLRVQRNEGRYERLRVVGA
jgi:hypothetical protein